jgi:hypothetical protein
MGVHAEPSSVIKYGAPGATCIQGKVSFLLPQYPICEEVVCAVAIKLKNQVSCKLM